MLYLYRITGENGCLDLRGGLVHARVSKPGLSVGPELCGIDPVEQPAEKIGVVLAHLTHN